MMAIKTFNISFPTELADRVDEVAGKQFGSRSDFLRFAALKYLREEQEFEELMAYGKTLGKTTGQQRPEEVAVKITKRRRPNRSWTK